MLFINGRMEMDKIQRIYKFDNIKFFCIITVVFGHLIEGYCDSFSKFQPLFLIIYTFHMPLLIFISGLFTKRNPGDHRFNINKFTFYIVIGFLLKFLLFAERLIAGKNPNFYWFREDGIPWFMFTLAAYIVFEFIFRKLPPVAVLAGTFIIGNLVGYFSFIGDTLCASRILVYMPFFFAGYYLTPETVIRYTSRLWVRISSAVLSIVYILVCFKFNDVVYGLRRLFTGKNPFSKVLIENCGAQHRLIAYVISIIICIAVISLIPNIKIPVITKMGSNTLAVFFWHMLIKNIMIHTGLMGKLEILGMGKVWIIVILILSVAIGMVLMLDVFNKPLKLIQKLINNLKTVWCLVILGALAAAGIVFTFVIK